MRQVLFTVPGLGIPIFGYGLMLSMALLGSIELAARRACRERLDTEIIYGMALWVVVGGLLGARSFYVAQYWGTRVRTFWEIFRIWEGGIVFYGSVIGATVAFFAFRARHKFPIRALLDVIAPSTALGIAFGRVGCFLNGCCYGDRCDLPWAVRFPAKTGPWFSQVNRGLLAEGAAWSLPVHPTQLYAAFDGIVLLALLTAFYPLRRRDGEVMGLLMLTYPISRFLIEHLRNDEGVFLAGMTVSQCISVGLFVVGLIYWYSLGRLPARRHADEPRPELAVA